MIYLTNCDWEQIILPKLIKEELFNEEFTIFNKVYNIVNYLINKLYNKHNTNDKQNMLISTLILFHKYKICSGNFSLTNSSYEELFILLGACIFIGQGITNILYKLEYLSTAIKNLLDRKEPSNQLDIKKISIKIIDQQYSILVTLGFNCNIDFPSSFQYKIKQYLLKKEYKSDNILELLTYTINDSYIFPICLYFIPDVIVICSIKYLKEKYKLDSINIYELIALSDYDLDKYEIEQCYTFIQKIQKEILFRKRKKEEEMKGAENNKLKTNEASITKVISSINMNVD